MQTEPRHARAEEDLAPVQYWAARGLPVPPTREIAREQVEGLSTQELVENLGGLAPAERDGGYWVLRQGPVNSGSARESLVNLDTDAALAAALKQVFSQQEAPERIVIQWLPGRRAAGVLFSRHPVRQDLEHIVVEGVVERSEAGQERIILHEDGSVAFHDPCDGALVREVGSEAFSQLARLLRREFERPQACEWIFDGERLWVVQTLPVGSLPVPEEAWCRRAGFGIWNQAITPLWYTLAGRWLKTGFWRNFGEELGWTDLRNMEPYRRLHGHIYTNSLFFQRLLREQDCPAVREAVPPAWRPRSREAARNDWRLDRLRPYTTGARLRMLERRRHKLDNRIDGAGEGDEAWRLLMKLDAVGEDLAALEGWLACVALPHWLETRAQRPLSLTELLAPGELRCLQQLGETETGTLPSRGVLASLSGGVDPVFPRGTETGSSVQPLTEIPGERRHRMAALSPGGSGYRLLHWRIRARMLRQTLGDSLRRLLASMSASLVASGRLEREEDIHFLYFDELWQLWQQSAGTRGPPAGLGERKLRYMANAWHGAPDWIIDQVAYGVRVDQSQHPVLDGQRLVSGRVSGPVRRIYSGWALEEVRPGDILVLDQCEPGWLPWLCLAAGLVLASRDPLDPAAALARALSIPAVAGVDDAMHCLVDEVRVELDGETGSVHSLE